MKKVFSLLLVLMLALSVAVPGMAAGKTKTKIALDKKGTVTLNLGETLKLTATVTPEAAVKWSSSKKSVATVENGLVTPRKEGKATITAKAGGKSAKVTVKVVDPKKPTGLTITQGKKATLDIDKTLTLGITLQPAGAESALKFKNSNKKVATVDANGVVTPKKEGKAKITVTSAKNKKAKATITITVKDPYKPTKAIDHHPVSLHGEGRPDVQEQQEERGFGRPEDRRRHREEEGHGEDHRDRQEQQEGQGHHHYHRQEGRTQQGSAHLHRHADRQGGEAAEFQDCRFFQ